MDEANYAPTTSDISEFMRELGYSWSNEAQIYYNYYYEHITQEVAIKLYEILIGHVSFCDFIVNGVDIKVKNYHKIPKD